MRVLAAMKTKWAHLTSENALVSTKKKLKMEVKTSFDICQNVFEMFLEVQSILDIKRTWEIKTQHPGHYCISIFDFK